MDSTFKSEATGRSKSGMMDPPCSHSRTDFSTAPLTKDALEIPSSAHLASTIAASVLLKRPAMTIDLSRGISVNLSNV